MKASRFRSIPLLAMMLFTQSALLGGREFIVGADLSALPEQERMGAKYSSDGEEKDLLEIFDEAGYTMIRLRLFLDADGRWGAVNDLPYTLAMAKRVKAAGFDLMLDFHYSDTWADPAHQTKPGAWRDLGFEQLVQKIHEYTYATLKTFEEAGATPDYVQIGNEITPGMLWPDGRISGEGFDNPKQLEQFSRLFNSASRAVDEALPENTPRKILHIDRGGDIKTVKWFFSSIEPYGFDYDVIGLSHYPFLHNTLEEVKESLHYIDTVLDKPFIIVETAHPYAPLAGNDNQHPTGFPHTPEGQYLFIYALTQLVNSFKNGMGVFYWYPEGTATEEQPRPWAYGRNALFDREGSALPALNAIPDAVGDACPEFADVVARLADLLKENNPSLNL